MLRRIHSTIGLPPQPLFILLTFVFCAVAEEVGVAMQTFPACFWLLNITCLPRAKAGAEQTYNKSIYFYSDENRPIHQIRLRYDKTQPQ